MKTTFSRSTQALLSILLAASIGCGDDDSATLGTTTPDGNNGSINNTQSNNSAGNAATNADPGNNVVINGSTGPDTGANNTTNNDVRDPRGDISFARPEGPTAYTNGFLVVEIDRQGQAADPSLVLDDTDVIHEFEDSSLFQWDTSSYDEGSYKLAVRYTLGETSRWSFDTKTVIVDRTEPVLVRTSPTDGDTLSSKDVPISLTFDEPIDVDTVTPTSVILTFASGETTNYTTTLSADGTEIMVDFDRDSISTPFDAQILLSGVTDLAGNTARADLDFTVEGWRAENLTAPLSDFEYASVGGAEYIVGYLQGSPNDVVRVYKRGAGWSQVATRNMNQVYDIDVDIEDGKIHVAVLHSGSEQGLLVKKASLLEFDPASDNLTAGGSQVVSVDSDNGAIALDVRRMSRGTVEAVAAVSDGRLSVFESINMGLDLQTANTFPRPNYDFVRDENVEVHVKADGSPEVVFSRCTTGAEPCYRTRVERMTNVNGTWTAMGTASTPISATSGNCDEFENFETVWMGDVAKMVMAYYGPCGSGSPYVMAREATGSAWGSFAVGIMNNPSLATNTRYSSHITVSATGTIYGLMSSGTQLMVTELGSTLVWHPEVAEGLETRGFSNKFENQRVYVDAQGNPLVIFRHQGNIRVYRRN